MYIFAAVQGARRLSSNSAASPGRAGPGQRAIAAATHLPALVTKPMTFRLSWHQKRGIARSEGAKNWRCRSSGLLPKFMRWQHAAKDATITIQLTVP
eukprot:CAMPEP_0179118966 /NCGR_PEP_ID=MMETSP0796-20121207/55981_1 /TAXON_ID=73915 /ORGANISM="Pyrodinium bahamense, Strain pbaha01" /LENGTH=96 /DNA_ID=CAMNT_0020817451 /DNA_START=63 /DNA_END=350 /DNA_ORIENTATION=-